MGLHSSLDSSSSVLSNNTKVIALDRALQQTVEKFKELVEDFGQLHIDSENYKLQYLSVRDKCKNKICEGAEELKTKIKIKDHIIQSVASILTKLNETKNLNILSEAFNILFENDSPLTPPTEGKSPKENNIAETTAIKITPNKNNNEADISITEEVSFKEESMSEIEGTPTAGRVSPIIQIKKSRTSAKSSDYRDKKKCPDEWPTSDSKVLKLTCTPKNSKTSKGGKLRQARLNVMKVNKTSVVDLTCSPEVCPQKSEHPLQPVIKKESFENDDTILPSPTSGPGPTNFIIKFKNSSKASPNKLKKPPLSLKNKSESVRKQDENKDTSRNANGEMEESINILNNFNNRPRNIKKENEVTIKKEIKTPTKKEIGCQIKKEKETPVKMEIPPDEDETNASISLLQHVNQIAERREMEQSPSKRPLAENINIMNTPPKNFTESSMSILQQDHKIAVENVKKRIPELVEPIYKEPTVRKKAEKRNLQGWSCEECMNFYGVLYKDDPVMLARKINECSKHRGKHNPARPKTPPNFWNPRWHVPEDTEELNRMNNAS